MSDGTKIEWTDATLNVQVGCTKVSPGCANCSALRDARRLSRNPNPKIAAKYAGTVTEDGRNWTGRVNFSEETLTQVIRWREPRRIFVNYTSDIFHKVAPDERIDRTFAVMALAHWHTFQVLTKRAKRAAKYFSDRQARVGAIWGQMGRGYPHPHPTLFDLVKKSPNHDPYWPWKKGRNGSWSNPPWPLLNVWLGFSAENQKEFDARWECFRLIAGQGWTVFVSCEPLLGPVALPADFLALGGRAQVIAGGESGKLARPSHPDWFRSLRDQCVPAGVAFLFKQHGHWLHQSQEYADGLTWAECTRIVTGEGAHVWPDGTRSVYLSKSAAGRILDGREWSEFPAAAP
ncbi:MAG: phage Gp37/Gp68 family protein [Acidobacteriota bacterium]|nr:phage Gp37/Gp68 family protein [Acidobacteriota bacterium]